MALILLYSIEKTKIPVVEADRNPMRILLAEDNISNQRVTLQMLADAAILHVHWYDER